MLKGSPVCDDRDGAERPAAEYRPRNAGAAEIVLSRSERQLVNGGEIEHLANVVVAARLIARSAEGILRRVGFPAANAAVVDRMRPHVIRREQEAVLKGSAGVELQRMEGAVSNVAAPRNRTERRVRRNAGQRIHQVRVGRGQNIRSFVSEIAGGSEDIQRQFPLNGRGPGRNVVVFPVAIQIARRNDAQPPGFRIIEKRSQRIRQAPGNCVLLKV